ncbi:hypothetical protein ABFS83_02G152500 [Erythranthe nasuta]
MQEKTIELQRCRVSPAEEPTATMTSLPLTFFDMEWINFHPLRRVFFYGFPCSHTHFIDTIIPQMTKSLSLTLKHYFPLAGNLIYPLNSSDALPVLRYRPGDSVPLTFSESVRVSDFDYLSGHQSREADDFYAYAPHLLDKITEPNSDDIIIPLLSLQVTLFPETGICIGIACNHVATDARSIFDFVKAWASITKLGGSDSSFAGPSLDRSLIKDPHGLTIKKWNNIKMNKIEPPLSRIPIPTNRGRSTFVLAHKDIEKLRAFVLEKQPNLVHLSAFTLASSLAWTCMVKSENSISCIDEDESLYFAFLADARLRCNPPLPEGYFGNCLASGFIVESRNGDLRGENGFLIGVEKIGELIRRKANDKDEIFIGVEKWWENYAGLAGERVFGVAESSKIDVYDADFGWGRPKKFEFLSIDEDGYSMSVVKSREFVGGLEIGLSLPVVLMDAFAGFFADALKK